ncbi:MAG TPA: DUF480 domain-containing protein, partial [Pelovirga sp.]|nr:DUF480 domain-containing protein [Pelovirga sp.]
DRRELAVLAILLLRGAQTVGEIRTRCERMHAFAGLAEVEAVLTTLSSVEPPLVAQLPRQPGLKDCRYIDLLRIETGAEGVTQGAIPESGEGGHVSSADRLTHLEGKVSLLEQEISRLQEEIISIFSQFDEFKSQFD